MIKCFLLEPIFDPQPAKDLSYDAWDKRPLLGFRHPETGEVKEWPHQFGPGAMWYATWMPKSSSPWDNQTGPPLCVETPGGTWDIDSRASNCTLPQDKIHRCWVRHGEPPNIHVDKAGVTCSAGAGSIQCGNYHGFLHNGHLI